MTSTSSSSLFLARPGPQTIKEIWSFVSEEDYVYFLSLVEPVLQDELVQMSYQTHKALVVMAFNVASKEDIIMPYRLQKEK